MIKDGVLENPRPQSILGQHVMPLIPVGKIGFKKGIYMASADEIYMTVKGKGGHGAMPDKNIDPVLIASHIIVALQQIVSRNATPTIPSVVSFGKVIAEGATNIIPNEVKIEGTFRTLNEEWRKEAVSKLSAVRLMSCLRPVLVSTLYADLATSHLRKPSLFTVRARGCCAFAGLRPW